MSRRVLAAVAAALLGAVLTGCTVGNDADLTSSGEIKGAGYIDPAWSDARKIVQMFHNGGAPVELAKEYDEGDDPEDLLGEPGGYESKAAFRDSRVPEHDDPIAAGGVVEVFELDTEARDRIDDLEARLASGELPHEYHFLHGRVVIRVSGSLDEYSAIELETNLGD
ncbi:hypothetical protein [Motilibacter aurantiacus]|uniref:hypothetical protein n=1 Tax=Motilibacter aurantiacus TaxID=2714955 RepID=UPI001408875F|nr:hypothetical protein [Motilibacter aurantiacus]NHC44316.1 hypothetical protein [Motilibacter aurantiacus]